MRALLSGARSLSALGGAFILAFSGWVGATPAIVGASGLYVSVSGNHLIDGSGQPLRLIGANRTGTQNLCEENKGIFDGPSDIGSVQAMSPWHINAVRIQLNEDCWLGINGVSSAYGGANYQNAIGAYVSNLNSEGIYAILDLHYAAPSTTLATSRIDMADKDHSPAFWASVAGHFQANQGVIFDLYDDPHNISWSCWKDASGCNTGYNVAGMQSLVNAVRGAGAGQPIIANGINSAGDLSSWPDGLSDPSGKLVAGFEVNPGSPCTSSSCWDGAPASLSHSFPVIASEVQTTDCSTGMPNALMSWADQVGTISYLGWAWEASGTCDSMVSSWSGSATTYGNAFRANFLSITAPPPTPAPTPAPTVAPTPAPSSAPPPASSPASGTTTGGSGTSGSGSGGSTTGGTTPDPGTTGSGDTGGTGGTTPDPGTTGSGDTGGTPDPGTSGGSASDGGGSAPGSSSGSSGGAADTSGGDGSGSADGSGSSGAPDGSGSGSPSVPDPVASIPSIPSADSSGSSSSSSGGDSSGGQPALADTNSSASDPSQSGSAPAPSSDSAPVPAAAKASLTPTLEIGNLPITSVLMGLLIGILALLAVFTLGMGAMALLLPLILWRNREPRGKPAATADQPVDSGMSPSTDEAAPDFYAFAGPRPDGRQSRPRQRVVGARATGSSRRLTGTDSSTNSSW